MPIYGYFIHTKEKAKCIMKNNLQKIRWEKELSQQSLAMKSGVSKSTICKIENGIIRNPSIEICYKLSKALDVDISDLFIPE